MVTTEVADIAQKLWNLLATNQQKVEITKLRIDGVFGTVGWHMDWETCLTLYTALMIAKRQAALAGGLLMETDVMADVVVLALRKAVPTFGRYTLARLTNQAMRRGKFTNAFGVRLDGKTWKLQW